MNLADFLKNPGLSNDFTMWLRKFLDNDRPYWAASGHTGGTSTGSHGITVNWSGGIPGAASTGTTLRVPELSGASHTWTLTKAYLRIETPGVGATTVVIEKMSPDSNATWTTATTVATLTVTGASSYETTGTISSSVTTGDLLRIRFTSVSATGLFTVEATGS